MDQFTTEFAGLERTFRFRTGEFFDVEEASGAPIGTLYKRLATSDFYAGDVQHVLRIGLVGGGMAASEADRLVRSQMDVKPLFALAGIAQDVILAAMTGIPEAPAKDGDGEDRPFDKGSFFASLIKLGVTPDQLRAMRYADFIALVRAANSDKTEPPSENEFLEMVRDWEDGQAQGGGAQ